MGFFSKLKRVIPYIEKGAALAQKGTSVANQAQSNPLGAALATVELIQEVKSTAGGASVALMNGAAHVDTVKAVAVAVDDHESRMAALEKQIALLTGGRKL